jgi:type IV pilus assembly protein PilF
MIAGVHTKLGRGVAATLAACLLLASGCATDGSSLATQFETDRRARAHYRLGVENLRLGRPALAVRELLAAAEYDARDAWIPLALAEAYRMQGNLELAEKSLVEALRLRPEFQEARLNLSALYLQMDRHEEAIAESQRLLRDPTFPVAWKALTNQGWAELQLGRHADARRSLELALQHHEDYWQAHLNLGILEAKEGHHLAALERFEKVLALQPGQMGEAEAHYRIAEIYVSLGNRDRAVQHLTAVTTGGPSGPWGKRSEDYLKRLR